MIDSVHSFRASDISLKVFLFFPNGLLSALKSLLNHSRGYQSANATLCSLTQRALLIAGEVVVAGIHVGFHFGLTLKCF